MTLLRIAVTGASGFVGGAVATALASAGHEVLGFGRRPGGWSHPRGTYLQRDLVHDAIPEINDVNVIVHAAALADDWADWHEAFDANVRTTGRLAGLAAHARLVHISSASVYDPFEPNVLAAESDSLPKRYMNAYGATKAIAERIAALHPNAIMLRPHAVYGPGDTTLLPRVESRIRLGTLALPGGGRSLHTVTHIDTMVEAVELSLQSTVTGPVNVGDAEPVAIGEFIADALAAKGRRVRIASVPVGAALAVASRAEGLAKLTGSTPSTTRYAVAQIGRERTLDLTRAHDLLGLTRRQPSLAFLAA
ncbi:MAG: NAD-dependent epimerase/dehydratase family protein [Agrococcus casei]|uniref:NAD-dependent epimerase/dehydratase family protein n=1 Tax=Agrococcus casei TaxID=343512 RepID=UPI003F93BDB7